MIYYIIKPICSLIPIVLKVATKTEVFNCDLALQGEATAVAKRQKLQRQDLDSGIMTQ